jgi:hypothetical protein
VSVSLITSGEFNHVTVSLIACKVSVYQVFGEFNRASELNHASSECNHVPVS